MVYGIPEAAQMSIEKVDKTQYFKCIKCAISNVDNHLTDIYQVSGTTYCLFHAKETYEAAQIKSVHIFNPPGFSNL